MNVSFKGEIENIRVISLDGKDVKMDQINDAKDMIDISSFAPGIYFLYVRSNGEWYQTKFSKI